jgi:hypothetical protein
MKSSLVPALALTCALSAGCGLLNNSSDTSSSSGSTPTSPSTPTASMSQFAGTWQSVSASTPPTGCGNLSYTVTPVSSTTANVSFTATCAANITVTGSGSGTLSGSEIDWSATGLVGQGGVNCPFSFSNSKAVLGSDGSTIAITYSGTVCGIPVSGTENVKK